MAVNVTPDDLLQEAYAALGEQTVHNRIIARHAAQLEAQAAAERRPMPEGAELVDAPPQ